MDRFGRVFIAEGSQDVLLKSACFSNLDLRWYDQVGDFHREVEKHGDKWVSLGFDVQNRNKDGEMETYHVRARLPYKLKDLPGGPTQEYLEFVKKCEMDLAKDIVLLDFVTEKDAIFGLSAFLSPQAETARYSSLLAYICLACALDDDLDSVGDSDDPVRRKLLNALKEMSFSMLRPFVAEGKLAIRGDSLKEIEALMMLKGAAGFISSTGLGIKEISTIRNYYASLTKIMEGLRDQAISLVGGHENVEKFGPFIEAMEDLIDAHHVDISSDWSEGKDHVLFRPAQEELRTMIIGCLLGFEAVALQLGISVDPEIRKNFLFKRFCREASSHYVKLNDILSYIVETGNGRTTLNEAFVLHTMENYSLHDAFKKLNDEANQCALRVIACEKMLLDFFDGDKQLSQYIQVVKGVMTGMLHGSCFLGRYYKNLKFDCYVHA